MYPLNSTVRSGLLLALMAAALAIVTPAQAAVEADNYAPPTAQALPVYAYTPITNNSQQAAEIALLPGASDPASTQLHPAQLPDERPRASDGLVPGTVSTQGQPIVMPPEAAAKQQQVQQAQQAQVQMLQNRSLKLTQYIKNYNKRLSWEQSNAIAEAIAEYGARYNVDFRITTGVIAVESGFRSDAVSSSGAIGLGQLKPATAHWVGVVNPFDPIDNVAGTTRYIGYLLKRFDGNVDKALAAYFMGPNAVKQMGITDSSRYYLLKVNNALGPLVPLFSPH